MLIPGSKVYVSDNTGVSKIRLFNLLRKKRCSAGDPCVASSIKLRFKKRISRGEVVKALIIRTKAKHRKINNVRVRFTRNESILITHDLSPVGTKVKGPGLKELRIRKYIRILPNIRLVI